MAQKISTTGQQKDYLCGSFCAARILNVDQDEVALLAGATLPDDPDLPPVVPPGASSKTGYRYKLPLAPLDVVGTSPGGLMRAIHDLSNGAFEAVPVRGEWSAETVAGFVDRATAIGARLIANLRTGKLWGSRPAAEQLLAELRGEAIAGPPADWDVGHFVELKLLVRVTGGTLVVVHDTYPSLGLDGYHLQPPRAVAAALLRGDGREGGILAVVSAGQAGPVESLARELGLDVGTWDNGCRS